MLTINTWKLRNLSEVVDRERALCKVVGYVLLYKIAFFIIVYLSFQMLPFSDGTLRANLHYPDDTINFLTTLKTWDGQHYHLLGEEGYKPDSMSNAFYPLYPTLMKLVSSFLGISAATAGLLISNILSLFVAVLLYLVSREFMSDALATSTVVLYLSYPLTFYTNILYSESLFLFLALGLFYGLYKDKYWIAVAAAFLLPLSRPQGVLVGLAILVFVLLKYRRDIFNVVGKRDLLTLLSFPLGVFSYFLFMHLATGNPLSGFNAQSNFISGNSISNIVKIDDWFLRNFVNIDLAFHGFTNSIIDRLFFVFYMVMLYFIYKKTDATLFTYALIIGMVPALSGTFMSFSRYTLGVFPIFMVLSMLSKRHFYVIATLFFAVQSVFIARHTLNHWMG